MADRVISPSSVWSPVYPSCDQVVSLWKEALDVIDMVGVTTELPLCPQSHYETKRPSTGEPRPESLIHT